MLAADHPAVRRRALAARVAVLAESLEAARQGSRDLGVDYPQRVTPTGLRRWAAALERANAQPRYRRE